MCFRFDSCFGSGSGGQDVGRSTPKTTHRGGGGQDVGRSTPKTTHRGGGGHWESLANHGYYSGAQHKPGPPAYPHQQPAAADEAGRRGDQSGGPHTHGNTYAPYTQDKADDETSKQHPAAWSGGKVGDDHAGAGHTYTERLHDAAAGGHKENAAMEYHHYQATNTATLAR